MSKVFGTLIVVGGVILFVVGGVRRVYWSTMSMRARSRNEYKYFDKMFDWLDAVLVLGGLGLMFLGGHILSKGAG